MLTRYARLGASSRLRMLAYDPWMQRAGIHVMVQSLHGDDYLKTLYTAGTRRAAYVLRAYWSRLRYMLSCGRVGAIWLEKELWPFIPSNVEDWLLRGKAPYVIDIDDAVFHNYDAHNSALVRATLGRKLDRLFAKAALVTAGSRYLEERARSAGARWVERVPTVIDLASYHVSAPSARRVFTIGWIGSPSTQKYLEPLCAVLKEIAARGDCRFVTIGTSFPGPLFPGHEQHVWEEHTEATQVAAFDVGIMPLPDTAFERGKCAYKLIQYMACGVPVVAAPVGANNDVVRHGENGFLVSSPEEWRSSLCKLRDDAELRRRMGMVGRRNVELDYSIQVMGPRVANLLSDVASGRGGV